jgi:hypothetical protein
MEGYQMNVFLKKQISYVYTACRIIVVLTTLCVGSLLNAQQISPIAGFDEIKQEHFIGEAGEQLDYALAKSIYDDPKSFCNKMMRLWEIRSFVHLNDPHMFNASLTDWGHHQKEPFLGLELSPAKNPLFVWAKTIKPSWYLGCTIESYYFSKMKYQLCATFSSSSRCWFSSPDGSRNHSTGIMLKNLTDNEDGKAGHVLYIAFRETTGWQQLITWLSMFEKTIVGSRGEAVLSSLYSYVYDKRDFWGNPIPGNIRQAVINAVKKEFKQNAIDKIVVTGLSLGGAIGYCVADDLSFLYPKKVELFTFGTPRVGNAEFVKTISENLSSIIRIELHEGDNVIGYKLCAEGCYHAGLPVRLMSDGPMYFGHNDIRSTLAWKVGPSHRRDTYLDTIFRAFTHTNQ